MDKEVVCYKCNTKQILNKYAYCSFCQTKIDAKPAVNLDKKTELPNNNSAPYEKLLFKDGTVFKIREIKFNNNEIIFCNKPIKQIIIETFLLSAIIPTIVTFIFLIFTAKVISFSVYILIFITLYFISLAFISIVNRIQYGLMGNLIINTNDQKYEFTNALGKKSGNFSNIKFLAVLKVYKISLRRLPTVYYVLNLELKDGSKILLNKFKRGNLGKILWDTIFMKEVNNKDMEKIINLFISRSDIVISGY